MSRALFTILWLVLGLSLYSQNPDWSNWRVKTLLITNDTFQLDSLPIVPGTFQIQEVDTEKIYEPSAAFFSIEYDIVRLEKTFFELIKGKEIQARYRVFPFDFRTPTTHLDTTLIATEYDGNYIGVDYTPTSNTQSTLELFNNNKLQYSGSFARGVTFGNSQNLVLNSQFNLQLAGKLGEDTEIVAALTDENIPLQATGNTQQLQEFDKVFIQINRRNMSLTAGDYEISSRENYFQKYFKKLQGATFQWEQELDNAATWKTKGSVAISRGQFARNILMAIEGNQGPYRLQGANGELFIIVLAGTERVFLDGQLLLRGIEEDYIIDYNRGELTFTNKRLITQNSRIIVEMEYIDQSFQRSLYALNSAYQTSKQRIYFSLYSQQDSKRAIGDTELSTAQRQVLQEIGDNLDNALASSIDTLENGFDEAQIQYELRDTFYDIFDADNNRLDTIDTSILVFSKNPQLAQYTARFSQVGQGNGNYRLLAGADANGRIYEWVAPDETGLAQGDFEPIQRLTTPKQQQLYSLGTDWKLGEYSQLKAEIALSNNDLNRFSTVNNDDNVGAAFFAHYQLAKPIGEKGWELGADAKYELVQTNFEAINPYRNAEFNRDWNISLTDNQLAVKEQIGKGKVQLKKATEVLFSYELSTFHRTSIYEGFKHHWDAQYKKNGYDIHIYGSLLDSEGSLERSQFSRPRLDISKAFEKLKNWKLGVYAERERNAIRENDTDELKVTSFYWDLYKMYLESPDNNRFGWRVSYVRQTNFLPQAQDFIKGTIADEVNWGGHWQPGRSSQLKWNFSYRNLEIEAPEITSQEAQETYLGRLDYSLNLWRGTLRFSTNYEIGSGQEARAEFQFIRVNTGEGNFIWQPNEQFDLNGDSIPQINEFVVAPFRDQANYIRINTFTNDFIRTNNVILNQSLRLRPRVLWHNKQGWRKVLSRFSTLSTLRINRKVRLSDVVSAWNPFDLAIADTSLITIASGIRNVLFFNQGHPIYDFQIGQIDNRNRNVLTTGFESRQTREQFFRSRWNITSHLSQETNIAFGNRKSDSELFDNRDFSIDFFEVTPQLSYLPNTQWEASFSYEFQKATNVLENSRVQALFHNLQLSAQYNRTEKLAFKTSLSFVNIGVEGTPNPTLELTLLEGLKRGRNFLWNLTLSRQLADNVQLNIQYEGRKTGQRTTIHLGSVQMRATF